MSPSQAEAIRGVIAAHRELRLALALGERGSERYQRQVEPFLRLKLRKAREAGVPEGEITRALYW